MQCVTRELRLVVRECAGATVTFFPVNMLYSEMQWIFVVKTWNCAIINSDIYADIKEVKTTNSKVSAEQDD